MTKSIVPVLVFAIAGAVGCAESRQYFRPTEHVYGHTLRGDSEAIYSMVGPGGPFGEAKVWSRGAFRDNGATVLYATIDVHNTSAAPIVVDPQHMRVDPLRVGRELLRDFPPLEKQPLSVAPGAFGSVRLHFVLPARVSPGQVNSFGLRWKVENGAQSYAQTTPFLEIYSFGPGGYPPPAYGFAYGYGFACSWSDPLCRPPYGYGVYGVRAGPPVFVEPVSPARPERTVIHTH